MPLPLIRTMTPADAPAAVAALVRSDFGDRSSWLAFATSHPACRTVVAEVDGEVVGTGVGTANGRVGWLATIWVAPDRRRAGLGRALTDAVIDQLEAAGCRSFVLVASEEGRRLYEGMGFDVQTRYRILEAPGLLPGAAPDPGIRPFGRGDLDAVLALDLAATGEDRRHAIEAFATSASAIVLEVDEVVRGFVVRAPWGGGATIASRTTDALRILDARRRGGGPSGRIRVGLLDENAGGIELLEGAGYRPIWSAPRMVRGAPIAWHPDWIWGQFNHAIG